MAMMGWMRRSSKYFLIVVVVAFVASLAYFGATSDRGGPIWVARAGDEEISAATYERAYRATIEQYRQAFKERFSQDLVRSLRVQEQVLDRLVTDRLMAQRARAEGAAVSDEELSAEIVRMPVFREGGRFSRDHYRRVLARAQLTEAGFEQDLRGDLLRRKLEELVRDGVKVSEAEVRQYWEGRRARVRAAYLLVSPEPFLAAVDVPDVEIDAYYTANPAQFTRPDRRRVLAATLPTASVPAPTVADADLQQAYEERRREFEQPTRARVSHILVRVPTVGGSEAEDQAKAKAEAALQRVRGGADFAQVAREVSEDPGTATRGGELGLVAPGEMVPQFEQAAFALKAGELGGPVRTPFGYHVIKVLETVPGSKKELPEVAPTLRATLVAEGQLRALREKALDVQQALVSAPDFAAAARERGLVVREIGPFARADAVEGIGRLREATDAIFALPADGVSGAIKVPEGYAIFRLLERQDPRLSPLAEVRTEVAQVVRRKKAQEAAEGRARELAEAWKKGEDPRELAKRAGATFAESAPFSRVEPPADRDAQPIVAPALDLPVDRVGGPVTGGKGVYVVKTLSRELPTAADFEKSRAEVEKELLEQKRGQTWQAWLGALCGRARGSVEVNRRVLPDLGEDLRVCGLGKPTSPSSTSRG